MNKNRKSTRWHKNALAYLSIYFINNFTASRAEISSMVLIFLKAKYSSDAERPRSFRNNWCRPASRNAPENPAKYDSQRGPGDAFGKTAARPTKQFVPAVVLGLLRDALAATFTRASHARRLRARARHPLTLCVDPATARLQACAPAAAHANLVAAPAAA